MKAADVQVGRVTALELLIDDAANADFVPGVGTEAQLVFPDTASDTLLHVGERVCRVEPADAFSRKTLARMRDTNQPRIAWIMRATSSADTPLQLALEVREFPASHTFVESMDFGVDDVIVKSAKAQQKRLQNVSDVFAFLQERFLLPPLGTSEMQRILLSASPTRDVNQQRAFRLHGHGMAMDLVRRDDECLHVVRLVNARRPMQNEERRPIFLVSAHVRFCDKTVAGQFQGAARTELDRIVEKSQHYLSVWNEYNRLEKESILRRARAFGWIHYHECRQQSDGRWRFLLQNTDSLEHALFALRDADGMDLEAAETPPDYLLGKSWDTSGNERHERAFVGQAKANLSRKTVDIVPLYGEISPEPPKQGVLFISLSGDRKRLERREDAHSLIASGECEMPQLRLLIEGGVVPVRRFQNHKPLSAAARAVFGGTPTDTQIKALKIALETPDIALIQGPPGTGKTRVIAALQIRLAEIAEERAEMAGQTLLTSYQHDAVEHAANQTIVFDLPAIKVGKKCGQTTDGDGYEDWRQTRIDKLRQDLAAFPERPAGAILRQVRDLALAYSLERGQARDAMALLDRVLELTRGHLPPSLTDRVISLRQTLSRPVESKRDQADDREHARNAIAALCVDRASFSLDGPRCAYIALKRLDPLGILAARERRLLESAAFSDNAEFFPFLSELENLRTSLLERIADSTSAEPPAFGEVESLLTEIVDALYRNVRTSIAGEEAVLHEYLEDLEQDTGAVREAIRAYTSVLAATCQQSAGHLMSKAKSNPSEFENVVVDEAARANPLDLFIPMSRARRRIILVGDHRQLPHLLERDIESQLDSSTAEATRDALRKSLFQRLFQAMEERELRDGITRTVTLDEQYRMHPALSDFVSDTFYKPHGKKVGWKRPASEFKHGLEPYGDAAAAWVDIPCKRGAEQGRKSKLRRVEAEWIAKEVDRILKIDMKSSIGVIAFYSAQVDEIMRQMCGFGICVDNDDGNLDVSPELAKNERLHMGTVDAFQGKEFDIVFLSVTRSNDVPLGDGLALRKYGHLTLENRLCVAMSRQRKLLVVVGDAGMFGTEEQAKAVPALAAFFQLCGGPHGIRRSA